jgi:hypothetical protein
VDHSVNEILVEAAPWKDGSARTTIALRTEDIVKRYEERISIDAPAGVVFDYVADSAGIRSGRATTCR